MSTQVLQISKCATFNSFLHFLDKIQNPELYVLHAFIFVLVCMIHDTIHDLTIEPFTDDGQCIVRKRRRVLCKRHGLLRIKAGHVSEVERMPPAVFAAAPSPVKNFQASDLYRKLPCQESFVNNVVYHACVISSFFCQHIC